MAVPTSQIPRVIVWGPGTGHTRRAGVARRARAFDGDRIAAVLDWGSSFYGDFLYEIAKLVFYRPWFPAWRHIDFASEAMRHYDAIGLDVPRFRERLSCYTLRIGLADMAYSAFRERWEEVEAKVRLTLEIARAHR